MKEELWQRLSSSKERTYTPAIEEAKALSDEEKIQLFEYALHLHNSLEDLPTSQSMGKWLWYALFRYEPQMFWQRLAFILPEHPTDLRYLPTYLRMRAMRNGKSPQMEVLSASLCHLLSLVDRQSVQGLPPITQDLLIKQLANPYQDVEVTLSILEVVPLLCSEEALPSLHLLCGEGKATLNMQRVSAAALIALRRLNKNLVERRETDALLRPAEAPDEGNVLLRPARDPVETQPEELLRPVEGKKKEGT